MTDDAGEPSTPSSPTPMPGGEPLTRREIREAARAATGELRAVVPEPVVPEAEVPEAVTASRGARRRRVPHRPPHRSSPRTTLVSLLAVVGILVGLGALGLFVVRPLLAPDVVATPTAATDFPGPGLESVQVTVPADVDADQLADLLVAADVVATREALLAAYQAAPGAEAIEPGTYSLLTRMRAQDAVAALLDPTRRTDQRVTIPLGWRTPEIYQHLADVLGVPVEDVRAAARDTAALGLEQPPNADPEALDPLEGWLYPTTYTIAPDETPAQVLRTMVDRTVSELDALGVAADDRQRVLTLASLAYREAFYPEDAPRVTRVIENRLAEGSPTENKVQMDSTLSYWWDLTRPGETMAPEVHDTDTGGRYNTRQVAGLPPSPIAAVDSRLMAAAVNPEPGDWIYFVPTELCSGATTFTADYDEFLVLRAAFREWLADYEAAGRTCPGETENQG